MTCDNIDAVSAPDRPPQPPHRCVEQTVAAEALEGWRPTRDQIDALAALVDGEVTFGDYLSSYLSRVTAGPVSEVARASRRDPPYLIPGTAVLRNIFGVTDNETLADLEFVSTAGRMACWHRRLADGGAGVDDIDVQAMHRYLFSDVYEWAGRYRITELRLGDQVFARRRSVQRKMRRVEASARALADAGDDARFAERLAALYAEYNYVHPFREGNGRTGTLMLHTVATLRGRPLDLSVISRSQWYTASHDSMSGGRSGAVDHRPLVPLLSRALGG